MGHGRRFPNSGWLWSRCFRRWVGNVPRTGDRKPSWIKGRADRAWGGIGSPCSTRRSVDGRATPPRHAGRTVAVKAVRIPASAEPEPPSQFCMASLKPVIALRRPWRKAVPHNFASGQGTDGRLARCRVERDCSASKAVGSPPSAGLCLGFSADSAAFRAFRYMASSTIEFARRPKPRSSTLVLVGLPPNLRRDCMARLRAVSENPHGSTRRSGLEPPSRMASRAFRKLSPIAMTGQEPNMWRAP